MPPAVVATGLGDIFAGLGFSVGSVDAVIITGLVGESGDGPPFSEFDGVGVVMSHRDRHGVFDRLLMPAIYLGGTVLGGCGLLHL